jgi:hypothetical protein
MTPFQPGDCVQLKGNPALQYEVVMACVAGNTGFDGNRPLKLMRSESEPYYRLDREGRSAYWWHSQLEAIG